MKRIRYESTTIARINGYDIDRDRIGAAVYWHALKIEDGYVVKSFRNCGSRAEAERIARADAGMEV
jgi:hypothetical protein